MDPNTRAAGEIARVSDLNKRESYQAHTHPEASKGEEAREKAEQRGQDQTQTQGHPTQRKKEEGPGGSNGQGEEWHARTREGTPPYRTSHGGPGTSKMNTSVQQSKATLNRYKVV